MRCLHGSARPDGLSCVFLSPQGARGRSASPHEPLPFQPDQPAQHDFHMVSSGTKLAQEIHEEFLCCKICLEGYRNPKSLNCLHTFCEQCIENHVMSESTYKKYSDYRDFTCPLCRKRTQLPIGGVKKLPDNFLVSSLSEVVGRQKPSKYPFCDICKMVNRKHREACSKCLDCNKLLCSVCVEMHKETKVTANHSLFDVQIEKDIECKEHQDEVVRFYCEPCETCICVLCTFNEHKDHDISQFGEAVLKYKENIQDLLSNCMIKIDKYDSQLETVNKCEQMIKNAEGKIQETAINFIQEIRNREKQLIEELQTIYGKETMEYIENKKEVAAQVESLRSTCTLTDVILKGKDIELLLLKKDVQQKLSSLNEVEIKNLPKSISKLVNFLPGSFNLGNLQDMDRPLLSNMRSTRSSSSNDLANMVYPTYAEKQTQTTSTRSEKEARAGHSDRSESESEGDTDGESDSEDDAPDTEDKQMQTDLPPPQRDAPKETNDTPVGKKSIATLTDIIKTEERGVNTRSRSLQTSSNAHGGQSKEGQEAGDSSLAARRRRRRERAHTTYIGGSHSVDVDDPMRSSFETGEEPLKERNFINRARICSNPTSIDSDDSYYDANPTSGRM